MAGKNRSTLTNWLSRPFVWALLIGGVTVLLRLPSLLEPHRYADEEIYLTLGLGLKRGLVFYRDIHDNKPPLLYLIAALAGSVFWLRFILLIWHGVNVWAFWKLARAVFEKTQLRVIGLLTLLFAVATAIPLTEGNIANGENFMIMPATLGAYLLWKHRRRLSAAAASLAGVLFALAFLFKVPIIFDLAGIGLFLFLINAPTGKEKLWLVTSRALWCLIAGFLVPISASIGYYALKGAFAPYVTSALLQNLGYLSSWGKTNISSQPLWQNGLFQRGMIVAGLTLGIYLLRRRLSQATLFASFWFAFSLYGALLSSRPYPHYLLEPLVPATLLIGLIFKEKLVGKGTILLVMACLPLAIWQYRFWYYKSLPYYQNFWEFALGQKSQSAYFGFFAGVNRNYRIARYVVSHTMPQEKIFVWGTEPTIYALSQRLPVGRYTVSYHIADFQAWEETLAALKAQSPPLIIFFTNETKPFPQLEAFLAQRYTPVQVIEEAVIYQKLY